MAKTLLKALANGVYSGKIVGVSTSADLAGVKTTFNLMDEVERANAEAVGISYYSIKLQLPDRVMTVNKFRNKIIWTDTNGEPWTSADFFLAGIQRQLGLEDETDDLVILKAASENPVNYYISQYINPNSGVRSYNVDTSKPKNWDAEMQLELEFED